MHHNNNSAEAAGTAHTNGRNTTADDFFTSPSTDEADTGGHTEPGNAEPPTALSGSFYAHLTDTDQDTPVGDALDGDALTAFNMHNVARKRARMTYYDLGTPLCDIPALPIAVAHHAGQDPTREEVTRWAVESLEDDPHEEMARFAAATATYRAERTRDRDKQRATERTLGAVQVSPESRFTMETIEAIPDIGPEVARKARALVLKLNRRAWNPVKPQMHLEHVGLISAAEMLSLEVDPAVIAQLVADGRTATEDDEVDAAERLTLARKHYTKHGTVEILDFAGGMVTPSQMRDKRFPRRLLGDLLYADQPSELIAPSGGGKTFVSVGMGCGLASGKARKTIGLDAPVRTRVLYVAAEAAESIYLRVLGWCVHHGIDPADLDGWFFVFPRPVQLNDPEHMRQVRKFVQGKEIGLTVLDTRAMVTAGTDENSSGEQAVAINAMKDLNADGSATLMVHHTDRKGTVGDGGRGTGAYYAAMYTSMHLETKDGQHRLVCDKRRDGRSGTKEAISFAENVRVPVHMMPSASEDERSTRALAHVDPFSEETRDISKPTDKHLMTLLVIARHAPFTGISETQIEAHTQSEKNPDGYDIGKRATISRHLRDLRGEGKKSLPEHYVMMVAEKPAQKYRLTEAGWDLLVEHGVMAQADAEWSRQTAEDLGSPRYQAAFVNIATALAHLIDKDVIKDGTAQSPTARKGLVQAHMQALEQEFSENAWATVHGRWKGDGYSRAEVDIMIAAADGD